VKNRSGWTGEMIGHVIIGCLLPGHLGLKGTKLFCGVAANGFVMGGLRSTTDERLSSRIWNGTQDAGLSVLGFCAANPFQGKTFKQIEKRLLKKEFYTRGGDPFNGIGAYFHPKTGRKYYFDRAKGPSAIKGNQRETPHVDVHRIFEGKNIQYKHEIPKNCQIKEPKRKYPLGDTLYVPK
jgi:hypothetical protein